MYLLQAPKRGLRFYYFEKPSYFPININNLRFALWLINHLEVRIPLNYLNSKELHQCNKKIPRSSIQVDSWREYGAEPVTDCSQINRFVNSKTLLSVYFFCDIFSQSSGVSGRLGMQLHHHQKLMLCKIIVRESMYRSFLAATQQQRPLAWSPSCFI